MFLLNPSGKYNSTEKMHYLHAHQVKQLTNMHDTTSIVKFETNTQWWIYGSYLLA